MKRKQIKAIFIGKNGSLHYETNKEYNLWIENHDNNIMIYLPNGGKECYYSSIFSFLNNWDCIRLIN